MATTVGSAAVLQMAASASEAAKKRFRQVTTDDAARVPLRLTAQSPWGEITVDLVDYQIPRDQ